MDQGRGGGRARDVARDVAGARDVAVAANGAVGRHRSARRLAKSRARNIIID